MGKKIDCQKQNVLNKLNKLPGFSKVPIFKFGDTAYPLTPYLMKEYTHCLQNKEVGFNNVDRASRNQIECALGRL